MGNFDTYSCLLLGLNSVILHWTLRKLTHNKTENYLVKHGLQIVFKLDVPITSNKLGKKLNVFSKWRYELQLQLEISHPDTTFFFVTDDRSVRISMCKNVLKKNSIFGIRLKHETCSGGSLLSTKWTLLRRLRAYPS